MTPPAEDIECPLMSAASQKSIVLIISGPAGSGKTTLCDQLTEHHRGQIQRAVTTTTRRPRIGEVDGIDYHFLTREAFEEGIKNGAFYEWAEVHGNLYGTGRIAVNELLQANHDVLLNIDVQGARAFRKAATEDALLQGRIASAFIRPASIEELGRRLEGRGTDSPESIARRLEAAKAEILQSETFDHVIVSGSREADYAALEEIYRAARQGTRE